MQNIQNVISRIAEIQNRFQRFDSVPAGNFSEALGKAQKQEAVGGHGGQNDYASDIPGLVRKAAVKYNVDPKLALGVAAAESNFNPDAVSSVGATGVMQLMPETAAGLGVKNIRDPQENIDGGVRYLKQLLATFNGDPRKAVAAYNAGPEAVKRYGGVPPYAETQNYVDKVLTNNC